MPSLCQPCKRIFEICFVFSHFFVRASNCSHYSNFGNKCPKLGTGTPQDMILTNLGDNLDSDPSGFVLPVTYILVTGRNSLSCKQKMSLAFGIWPIIHWYFGYLKQEKTKNSSYVAFQVDRLKFFPYKTSFDR